jgi:hypothetical protein
MKAIEGIINDFKKEYGVDEKNAAESVFKGIPFEEYKDERGADKTSRKQRCGDCYRKI